MRLNLGTNTNPTNFHSAFETRIRPIDPPTAISNTEKHCRHVVLVTQGERGRRYRYPVGVGLLEDPGLKSELYIYIHHPHPPHPQRPTRHTIHNGFKRNYFRLPRPLPPALGVRQWNLQFPRPWRLPHCWQHWQRKWGTFPPPSRLWCSTIHPPQVKRSIIFRSIEPNHIQGEGIQTLTSKLGITSSYDLRSRREVEQAEAAFPTPDIPSITKNLVPVFGDQDMNLELTFSALPPTHTHTPR